MVPSMTLEIILIGLSFLLTGALAVYVQRRPVIVSNSLQAQLNALRLELEQERRVSRENREQLQEVLERNRRLYSELQRQGDINAWMWAQLRSRNITLPPLPMELQESRLDMPSIAIHVKSDGGSVTVNRDIVGGNVLRENAQTDGD